MLPARPAARTLWITATLVAVLGGACDSSAPKDANEGADSKAKGKTAASIEPETCAQLSESAKVEREVSEKHPKLVSIGGTFGEGHAFHKYDTEFVSFEFKLPAKATLEILGVKAEGERMSKPQPMEIPVAEIAVDLPLSSVGVKAEAVAKVAAVATCAKGTVEGTITIEGLAGLELEGAVRDRIRGRDGNRLPWLGPVDTEHRTGAWALPSGESREWAGMFGDEAGTPRSMSLLIVGTPTGKTKTGERCRYTGGISETYMLQEAHVVAYDPRTGEELAATDVWPPKKKCTDSATYLEGSEKKHVYTREVSFEDIEEWAKARLAERGAPAGDGGN